MRHRLTQADQDARDLRALALLDQGLMQTVVCQRTGVPRGSLVRMLREIREDVAQERADEAIAREGTCGMWTGSDA